MTRTMQNMSQMLDWNIIIMVEKFCKTRVLSDNYSFLDQSMPGAVIDGSTWDYLRTARTNSSKNYLHFNIAVAQNLIWIDF